MWAGLVPSRAVPENLFHALPLDSGGLLAIFGIPWLAEASPRYLPSESHRILPVSVSKFVLCIRTAVLLD